MKLAIINGPNLNLLGTRETDVYGDMPFEQFLDGHERRHQAIIADREPRLHQSPSEEGHDVDYRQHCYNADSRMAWIKES